MKKWDDKVDKQLRDSLDDLEFSFEEASWDKMNAKLNQTGDKPVGMFWGKKGYIVLLLVLFVSFTSLYSVGLYYDWFTQNASEDIILNEDFSGTHTDNENQIEEENLKLPSQLTDENELIETENNETEVAEVTNEKVDQEIESTEAAIISLKTDVEKNEIIKTTVEENEITKTTGEGENSITTIRNTQIKKVESLVTSANENNSEVNEVKSPTDESLLSNRLEEIDFLNSKTELRLSDGFFSGGGINNLEFSFAAVNSGPFVAEDEGLSKAEKQQMRANAREIRKKLGSHYRKPISNGSGKFSLKPLNWGVRVGVGLKGEELKDKIFKSQNFSSTFSFIEGLNAGLYFEYLLKNRWQLQVELAYSRMNQLREHLLVAENNIGFNGRNESNYDFTYNLTAIELVDFQSVLQYSFGRKGMLEVGGSVGWVIPISSSRGGIAWSANTLRRKPQFLDPKNALKKINAQVIMGYEYALSNKFSVNARYYLGVLDLTNESFFNPLGLNRKDFDGGSRLQISIKMNLNRSKNKSEKE